MVRDCWDSRNLADSCWFSHSKKSTSEIGSNEQISRSVKPERVRTIALEECFAAETLPELSPFFATAELNNAHLLGQRESLDKISDAQCISTGKNKSACWLTFKGYLPKKRKRGHHWATEGIVSFGLGKERHLETYVNKLNLLQLIEHPVAEHGVPLDQGSSAKTSRQEAKSKKISLHEWNCKNSPNNLLVTTLQWSSQKVTKCEKWLPNLHRKDLAMSNAAEKFKGSPLPHHHSSPPPRQASEGTFLGLEGALLVHFRRGKQHILPVVTDMFP